jgi:hypothetical protein
MKSALLGSLTAWAPTGWSPISLRMVVGRRASLGIAAPGGPKRA